jgi:glycosyltransferase involved in cell wall biosynthesis
MRLLFVADGRSPIALNWIQHFATTGHEVHLASTYPCEVALPLASLTIIPVAFSSAAGEGHAPSGGNPPPRSKNLLRTLTTPRLRTAIRQWFGPLTLAQAGRRLHALIQTVQPALVHAMRIPYEGLIAAQAHTDHVPLVVSIWGNDFTLHAPSTPLMARLTRQTLRHADALHTDCHRDMRLAHAWGFETRKPGLTVPGNGGIDLNLFYPPAPSEEPEGSLQIINPRGFRAYVRNDTFFQAIPRVLAKHPQTRFLLPAMFGDPHATPYQNWLHAKNLDQAVEFLPHLPRPALANLFRQAALAVSPTEHDGTPNTLLEAMACGCLPVAGEIESLREWITPGENGLLFDPGDAEALAAALMRGLEDADLRRRAAKKNARLITDRAEYRSSMAKAEQFYLSLLYPSP